MLVLTRKVGEEIVIDGAIRIKISKIKGSNVSIAIEAPKDVRIIREELDESDNGGTENMEVPAA